MLVVDNIFYVKAQQDTILSSLMTMYNLDVHRIFHREFDDLVSLMWEKVDGVSVNRFLPIYDTDSPDEIIYWKIF